MAVDIYTTTKQRLEGQGVFSPEIIESIAQFAKVQAGFKTYQDFFTAMGVGEVRVHRIENGDGVPVIDIPAREAPERGVLVVHAPMGVPLDQNQLFQLATIAGTNPHYRVIGFGNPASDRYYVKAQELNFLKRVQVALFKNMRPIVAPEIDYLKRHGVTEHFQIGYSYGALKATAESGYVKQGDLKGLLLIDPVAKPRNLIRLIKGFKKTFGPLGKYVNAANLKIFHTARGDAGRDRDHNKALLRPINITIAIALSRINILTSLRRVLTRHPYVRTVVAYGSASELGDDAYMQQKLTAMNESEMLKGRVQGMRLEGLEHAFANDVHLHAAIVGEFLVSGRPLVDKHQLFAV